MYWRQGVQPGTIHVFAPAKLNLTLEVGPPREDGYHVIASVMVPISLMDELTLSHRADDQLELEVSMSDQRGVHISENSENLALRAARLLQAYVADQTGERRGASIKLQKHIPVAAGLAGGSADAAAVLVGLNQLWQLGLRSSELAKLGEQLGADVPFCIRSKAGLVEGIGEQYTPLAGVPRIPVVLINPRRPLSTASVFRQFDAECQSGLPGERTMQMVRALFNGELRNIAKAVYNDLERPAQTLAPEIVEMEECLNQSGVLASQVTGSGPTVFGIADSDENAKEIYERCCTQHAGESGQWWVWWGWAGAIESSLPQADLAEVSSVVREG